MEGEISAQSLPRNVYCTKEIACFPYSVILTVDRNAFDAKIIRQPLSKSMLE